MNASEIFDNIIIKYCQQYSEMSFGNTIYDARTSAVIYLITRYHEHDKHRIIDVIERCIQTSLGTADETKNDYIKSIFRRISYNNLRTPISDIISYYVDLDKVIDMLLHHYNVVVDNNRKFHHATTHAAYFYNIKKPSHIYCSHESKNITYDENTKKYTRKLKNEIVSSGDCFISSDVMGQMVDDRFNLRRVYDCGRNFFIKIDTDIYNTLTKLKHANSKLFNKVYDNYVNKYIR